MKTQLPSSTSEDTYTLALKNGKIYTISAEAGRKLEDLLLSSNVPKFVRVQCDGIHNTISISMIAELYRDVVQYTYRADWLDNNERTL